MIEGVPGLPRRCCPLPGDRGRRQFSRIHSPRTCAVRYYGHAMYDMKSEPFACVADRCSATFCWPMKSPGPGQGQAALLEVMQEHGVTIEGKSLAVPRPVNGTGEPDPIEHEGTYLLPEAQLDRFVMKVLIDFPDAEHEQRIALNLAGMRDDLVSLAQTLDPLLDPAAALSLASLSRVSGSTSDRGVRVAMVRNRQCRARVGAGPRRPHRCFGWLSQCPARGRDFVIP